MVTVVRDADANSVKMYFEIKDSGIGMTDEQMERIFDTFTQAESGTTRKYGGTGLGLAITKSIIEMMGGTLSVESAPGVGSKFSFELTFNTVDSNKEIVINKITSKGEIRKPAFEGEVLICEDNGMNQQVACEHLARVGLKTVVAENGQIGVDLVRERKEKGEKQFDLIFMDMHMPVMDGIEATEQILEMGVGVPIIAMTANVMSNDTELYSVSGMSDFVGKPFTSQELWRCLLKHLEPVTWAEEDTVQHEQQMDKLQQKLISSFVMNNRDKITEIKNAINKGELKLAHRMVHTIKSNAGQLQKKQLQQACEKVEASLKNGENNVTPQQWEELEMQMDAVLAEHKDAAQESEIPVDVGEPLDSLAALELIDVLEPLLKGRNTDCLTYVDSLRSIAGSETLIKQMENFDFRAAMNTLAEIKKEY